MSVSKLIQNGVQVVFEKDRAVLKQDATTIAEARRAHGLYFIDVNMDKCSPQAHTTTGHMREDSVELWHRRLGHVSRTTVRKMFNDKMVESKVERIAPNEKDVPQCVSCLQGKMQKDPFVSQPKAAEPGEMFYLDDCGPF